MRNTIRLACISAIAATSGCASVHVYKVVEGKDQPEGIPFYLPRPYVQVYEPFVVASDVFLAAGQVSPDGKYLYIDNVAAKGALASILVTDPAKDTAIARVPVANVRIVPTLTAGAPQSGSDAGSDSGDGKQADKPAPAASSPAAVASAPAGAASGAGGGTTGPVGQFTATVSQSSVPFPSTLGRRFFDVVWMPDFDEKYVVQSKPGLGNANVGVTMVQGWGLYGLDARIDNAAIVKPLLDFYSTGLGALSQLAKTKILPASVVTGGVQSGPGDGGAGALAAGTRVSVKITRVSVAAPGLYPVLKSKESAEVRDAVSGNEVAAKLLIPRRPYSNIAFNIYDVLVIEAAKPSGDTPMNLQRYFDTDAQGNVIATPAPQVVGGAGPSDMSTLTSSLNTKLKAVTSEDKAYWVLSDLALKDGKLTGKATLTGGKKKPDQLNDMKALADFISLEAKVAANNITVTEKAGG